MARLKYQTGIVTLIQFIAGTVLAFLNDLYSSVTTCTSHGSDCVSNTLVSLLIIILTAIWFAFIAVLGYATQDRRSHRLAYILILAEAAIAGVALLDARHYPNLLGLITSLIDFGLAVWTIWLAIRIIRAKGGRVVVASRPRKRRASNVR